MFCWNTLRYHSIGTGELGQEVVVELKNDTELAGVVDTADKSMNLSLLNCTQTLPDGKVAHFESMSIDGKAIRYVHFPAKLRLGSLVGEYVRKTERIRSHNLPHAIKNRNGAEVLESDKPKEIRLN